MRVLLKTKAQLLRSGWVETLETGSLHKGTLPSVVRPMLPNLGKVIEVTPPNGLPGYWHKCIDNWNWASDTFVTKHQLIKKYYEALGKN